MSDKDSIDRHDVIQGLLYDHSRINLNTIEAHKALASVEALLELLIEQGLVSRSEYEARREMADKRLRQTFVEQGMGVAIQEHPSGKYELESSVEIDCEKRLHLCKAACCRLSFALSKEDVEEGIVRWNLAQPYMIAKRQDGCCAHLDAGKLGCQVYANRPIPCRTYDCRNDRRVWEDFDAMIPNPFVGEPGWPGSSEDDDEGR